MQEHLVYSRLWWAGLLAAAVAAVANLIVFILAQNLLDIPLVTPAVPGSTELSPLAVIIASVVPAVWATLLRAYWQGCPRPGIEGSNP